MTESVTTGVLAAVAAVKGVDTTALPPLHDVIDPDALDAFFADGFADGVDGARADGREVRFRYAGERVAVRDDIVSVDGREFPLGAVDL